MHKSVAKGIKKQSLKKKTHSDFERCLESREVQMVSFNTIRSKRHEIYTYKLNKVGLSAYDDKRYLLDDGVESLSYGHYQIRERKESEE